jgi:uncharacterized membrane protein
MEAFFSDLALKGAVLIEFAACVIVFSGAGLALYRLIPMFGSGATAAQKRSVYSRFGMWLLFGLEFELAADIIRSAISPNWTDIAQLGAIAAIRTFLNYFLTRDIEGNSSTTA